MEVMYLQVFIPTCISGWKFCIKNPSFFFRMGSWREYAQLILDAQIQDRKRCDDIIHRFLHELSNFADLVSERDRLKKELAEIKGVKR